MWTNHPEIYRELLLVDEYIKGNTKSRNRLLNQVVVDLVEAGGKRLRPALAILSAKFGNYNRDKLIPVAGAIEILHNATLIHDDIIDEADLRRGRITVYEKYGSDMAIYAGDFLFTKAVQMLSSNLKQRNLDIIAKAIKTICEGEVDQFEDRYNIDTSTVTYLKRISRKTAVLFGSSCAIGSDVAGCSKKMVKSLARFGLYYGTAFQIRDDINDFISDSDVSGKPVYNDIVKGVFTLPLLYVFKSEKRIKETIKSIIDNKDSMSAADVKEIVDLVKERGGIEYSIKILKKYIDRGLNVLDEVPDSKNRDIMIELISGLML